MMNMYDTIAQGKEEYTVAIFLYDGVELLDFSGPGEVFGATEGFEVYTVSIDGNEITSQGFVNVLPEYSIETAPRPDIVVLPGGGTGPISRNQRVLNWIQDLADGGTMNISVCTGARILASAGLLDGLNVTTWYGFTDRLRELLPNSTVLENTRFVDSGQVLTTAGVSAGIDGALHTVARIKGYDVAKSTAQYMEYDKWQPEEGRIDYENPIVKAIREKGIDRAISSMNIDFDTGKPAFFEGEMKNLGFEYMEREEWNRAEEVFELVTRYYPQSVSSFEILADIYDKQDKYSPPKEEEFIEMIMEGNIDRAFAEFRKAREHYPGWMMFRERYLNWAGYQYLEKEQFEEATTLFRFNVEVFPESANAYDSLGEAHEKSGRNGLAVKNYKKALQLDPSLESSRKALYRLSQQDKP